MSDQTTWVGCFGFMLCVYLALLAWASETGNAMAAATLILVGCGFGLAFGVAWAVPEGED